MDILLTIIKRTDITQQAKDVVSILEHAKDLTVINQKMSVQYINEVISRIVNNYYVIM